MKSLCFLIVLGILHIGIKPTWQSTHPQPKQNEI